MRYFYSFTENCLYSAVNAPEDVLDIKEIVLHYDHPSIPTRSFDYSAAWEDYDIDDPVGHGETELLAIADLLEVDEVKYRIVT